jgi:hypothetical protein
MTYFCAVDGTRTRKENGKKSPFRRAARRAPARTGASRCRSRPFEQRVAELEAAIASVTRALGSAAGEAVEFMCRERGAMRDELRALKQQATENVVVLESRQR